MASLSLIVVTRRKKSSPVVRYDLFTDIFIRGNLPVFWNLVFAGLENIEALLFKVLDTWRIRKPQRVGNCKNDFAVAMRVC